MTFYNKFDSIFSDYKKALSRFKEVLQKEKNDIVRDSAIKRFELVFDISWKLIKSFVEEQKGLSCRSPKDCFRTAFQQEIIDFDNYWIVITDWRNSAVHTYKESIAEELYGELPKILEKFEELEKRLQN
ncbi:MAG: HI0074 family nucleotidyltransferase substrate-binding subunit [Patescibacteria group bacterium]|nr:HI0074 family nucleotidyltransferase substrate-binding subunit [Patescibacteria group bacterium]